MPDVTIRELQENDLWNGFLKSLDSLRKASDLEREAAGRIFQKINTNPDHVVIVAELNKRIVGCITLLIEQKFIHNGGKVGHIEDVVVSAGQQGMGIGRKIVNYALDHAKSQGCYKTILHCTDDAKPFYEKLGFKQQANGLRFDY